MFPPSPETTDHSSSSGSIVQSSDDSESVSPGDPDRPSAEGDALRATVVELPGGIANSFNTAAYSDCILRLTIRNCKCEFFLHSVVLCRSGLLKQAVLRVPSMKFDDSGRIILNKNTNLGFLIPAAIHGALQSLYSDRASITLQRALEAHRRIYHAERYPTIRMLLVIRCYTAGFYLQIVSFIAAALEVFPTEITLNNVEFGLAFALHGAQHASDHNPYNEKFNRNHLQGTFLGLRRSVYGPGTEQMVRGCLKYLTRKFPKSLIFDPNAPMSYLLGAFKLPSDEPGPDMHYITDNATGAPVTNIELSKSTSRIHTLMSTLLLSLPFNIIAYLYGRLGRRGLDFDIHKVIHTRNNRSLDRLRIVARATGIQFPDEVNFQNIPPALFADGVLPNRAKWLEKVVVTEEYQEIIRCWLGPKPDPQLTSVGSDVAVNGRILLADRNETGSQEPRVSAVGGDGVSASVMTSGTKSDTICNWIDDVVK